MTGNLKDAAPVPGPARLFLVLLLLLAASLRGDLACATWNMHYFPSGEKGRVLPAREPARIARAGALLKAALAAVAGTNAPAGTLIFLQEVRDAQCLTNLAQALDLKGLRPVAVSAFRQKEGPDFQQLGILSDLPVLESGWRDFKWRQGRRPPRGYAYALLDAGEEGTVACLCVHLKSNKAAEAEEGIALRENQARQLVEAIKDIRSGHPAARIVLAGDLNTDTDQPKFAREATLRLLTEQGGLTTCHEGIPLAKRLTIRQTKNYPGATFDHVLLRGLRPAAHHVQDAFPDRREFLSDHDILALRLGPEKPAPRPRAE